MTIPSFLPRLLLLLALAGLLPAAALAQSGIRGRVSDAQGEPLPFVSIYIKQVETGTSTNLEGYFEYPLPPGPYTLVFQHLGYATETRQIQVGNGFAELQVALPEVAIRLREVEVTARSENPAYAIMRKAIAKAKYHELQVDRYTCTVYLKGKAQLKDIPFLFRKKMMEEGVDTSTLYLTESVNEIAYERPNTVTERVVAIRTIGENQSGQSPNQFLNGSFYKPKVADFISPLSPRAFAHYRFQFEGSFLDQGREINKIRVLPRVRGEQVFEGHIFIVEDLWSLHSLDLTTYMQGFKVDLRQMYAPIQEAVWMPVNHQIDISGSVFGFDIAYAYLASVRNYAVVLNPDLEVADLEVVDERTERELAASLQDQARSQPDTAQRQGVFQPEEQLTRKQLKAMLRDYERAEAEERQQAAPPDSAALVAADSRYAFSIDSAATKHDSTYWLQTRPIPLNPQEINSYRKLDSLAVVAQAKADSLGEQPRKKRSPLGRLLMGFDKKTGPNSRFSYESPLMHSRFNTVEGMAVVLPLKWEVWKPDTPKRWTVAPTLRYAAVSHRFNAKLRLQHQYHANASYGTFALEGGRYVQQFNGRQPIHPGLNALWSVLFERNHMKLFERDYVRADWRQRLGRGLSLRAAAGWELRRPLSNQSDYRLFDVAGRSYTPNVPDALEAGGLDMPEHQALLTDVALTYRSKVRYTVRNGKVQENMGHSPEWHGRWQQGWGALGGDVSFSHLSAGFRHHLAGPRGRLDLAAAAGQFWTRGGMQLPDYRHFMGNRTLVQLGDPLMSFRLLDYYAYSTQRRYAEAFASYQFRRLLFTQIWELRMLGIKERLFVNALRTGGGEVRLPDGTAARPGRQPLYWEAGYSIENLLRAFRIEAVASFHHAQFHSFGIRIGISPQFAKRWDMAD